MLRPPSNGLLSVDAPMKLVGPPKVPLAPGKGLMDWVRLCNNNKDMTGVQGKPMRVTEKDMAMHTKRGDCWMIINNKVYNVTPYMSYHPGGADELMRASGRDGTSLFNEIHPWINYDSMMKACFIGYFTGSKANLPLPAPSNTNNNDDLKNDVAKLAVTQYHGYTLGSISKVSHDTNVYELVPNDTLEANVPIGHHIFMRMDVDGMLISRPYTPVSRAFGLSVVPKRPGDSRSIYLMIKIYDQGTLTPTLDKHNVGDTIDVSDPVGTFDAKILDKYENLILVAAGTGFTPMVRVIEYWIALRPNKKPANLLFFNKTQNDILWKDRLDNLCRTSKLNVTHILSKPDEQWTGLKGRVNKKILESSLGKDIATSACFAAVCGPNEFTESAAKFFQELGLSKSQIHLFKS